jgi:A/G-specific adenine glycosylase
VSELPLSSYGACTASFESLAVARELLTWIESARRDLPWRKRRDPYAVWISEVMLQQTRAETVAPYFERWMSQFPDIESLAVASMETVLKAWEGLGYYARARNLHRTAQQVIAQSEGRLPQERRLLTALPGIGRYTAGAILSLAYGLPEPAVDGNVRRVLCRLCNVEDDAGKPSVRRLLWQLAAQIVAQAPDGRAGDLNEALMELGALICIPGNPTCDACPLAKHCEARELGVQGQRPLSVKRPAVPHYPAVAGVIQDPAGRLLLVQRHPSGLLGGMWGFPGATIRQDQALWLALERAAAELVGIEIAVKEALLSFRHVYTHFSITLHAYDCELRAGTARPLGCAQVAWAMPGELESYPLPVTDRKIAQLVRSRAGLRDSPDERVQ